MKHNHSRRYFGLSALTGCLLAAAVALAPATVEAHKKRHDDGCRKVKGTWSSSAVPTPPCTSPIGICTDGRLRGSLAGGSYDFTMNSMTAVPEPDAPFVSFFSGTSFVTTRDGRVFRGIDTGAMNVSPPGFFGSGKFTTLLSFVEGATGYLQIRGTLDFVTGAASGDYQGEICPD